VTPTTIKCRDPRKSRAIPLLILRAFVAYKKGETCLQREPHHLVQDTSTELRVGCCRAIERGRSHR